MRIVIQRVIKASVAIEGQEIASINKGLTILLGIKKDDDEKDMDYLIGKILNLRIFDDSDGVMNQSVTDVGGEILIVSQFTLYGDSKKGRRPSYSRCGPVAEAEKKYNLFVEKIKKTSNLTIKTGVFQEVMMVSLINDGPVTLLLDSEKEF